MEIFIAIGIGTLVSCIVIIIGKLKDNKSTSEYKQVVTQMDELDFRKQLLKELGVEIIKEHKKEVWTVGYQGGVFDIVFQEKNHLIDIYFRNFNSFSHEQYIQAAMVANEMNLHHVWTCFLTREEMGQTEKPVMVNLSLIFFPQGTVNQVAAALKALLPIAFEIRREFDNQMQELLNQKKSAKEDGVGKDFQNKMELMKLRQEVGHDLNNPQADELPPNEILTVKALTDLFADVDWGIPVEMKILIDNKLEIQTEAGIIMAFNLREYIRECAVSAIPQELTIMVAFESQNLLVNLKKEKGSSDRTLFYRICISCNGILHYAKTLNYSSLAEIRLTTEEEDFWEAKYLIDEALDKWNNGKRTEMTDEQLEIVNCTISNVELDLYFGKKLYNQKYFLQALGYFKRIYHALNYQLVNKTEENRDFYYRTCCYIGSIYMELKMYDTAYYYLHRAQNGKNMFAIQEFTNCLCNMPDIDAIQYVQSMYNSVLQALHDTDEPHESVLEFYRFMRRRMAYTLIENRQLEEAAKMLRQMASNGEDTEFARKELEYIKELKEKEVRITSDTQKSANK